eukprot:357627-Chlamydomonas_euryale.AAC.7
MEFLRSMPWPCVDPIHPSAESLGALASYYLHMRLEKPKPLHYRVALNGERYTPFTVHPVSGRRRGRRRPAAPTPVDLSHTPVEPAGRTKTDLAGLAGLKASRQSTRKQVHQEHYRCHDASDSGRQERRPRPAEGLEVQWHL